MREVLAVVVHWDGGIPKSIKALKNWMENNGSGFWYHRFINRGVVDYGRSTAKRCTHCAAEKYTKEAVSFFGKYCPSWDHKERPHDNSPNNCTIGICILHDYEDGGYSDQTLLTAAKNCADMLGALNLGIDALWTHSMICGEEYKHCPKIFVEKPEQWENFKNMVKHFMY